MGDQNQGGAALTVQVEEQSLDGFRRVRVQVSRRLVGEKDPRPVDKGPSQGDPLLLPSGKLSGVVTETVPQAHLLQQFSRPRPGVRLAPELAGNHHVFLGGQRRDELKRLEDKTDVPISERGQLFLGKRHEILRIEDDPPFGGTIEPGAQPQQSRFAATRGTDDGAGGALFDFEVDIGQHRQFPVAAEVGLGEALDLKNRVFHISGERRGTRVISYYMATFPKLWASLVLFTLLGLNVSTFGSAEPRRILVFGDSLTAGYGIDPGLAFPAVLQEKIAAAGLDYEVVNGGVSGDTTAGGLRRIDWLLRRPVDILLLELGANDGLRGIPLDSTKRNLQAIIDRARARYPDVRLVIAGMLVPPNLGPDYTQRFREIFEEVASENEAVLIPFLLEGVAGRPDLNLPDGIHPTPAGHRIVAENVWSALGPLLAGGEDQGG